VTRRLMGVATTALVVFAVSSTTASTPGSETLVERVWDRAIGRTERVEALFDAPSGLAAGDPVLRFEVDALVPIGRVVAVAPGTPERVAMEIDGFDARRLRSDAVVRAATPGSNLGWALEILTPPELRARLAESLGAVVAKEGEAALAEATPVAKERLRAVVDAAVRAFPEAFDAERDAWNAAWGRLSRELWDETLAPVAEEEFWPRLRAACAPPAAELAEEIVRDLGFGAFFRGAWARAKDAAGVGDERALQSEIERLVAEKVAPVVRKRAPALAAAATAAAEEAFAEEKVRAAIDRCVEALLADAEARAVLGRVVRRVFVDDARVREAWRATIEDPRLRAAASRVARAAEPVFESALRDALLRDDAQGLDLRLVRVLRNVLLWKDRRYALLERGAASAAAPFTGPLRGVRGD
jgi:hypothetical protein